MIDDQLQVGTQDQTDRLSFLTYWHGHHALEFIYQTVCNKIDLDSRADIDQALEVLFAAEKYLPAPADDYLPIDTTTPIVEAFLGVGSSVRYQIGWVNAARFDSESLNDVNEAISLLTEQLKPEVGSDLELCFKRVTKYLQHLTAVAQPV